MEWFTGGIASAIATCRQRKALFIVFVQDESPASGATLQAWNSAEVQEVLRANDYVAVRVMKDSIECQQFSQLFVVFMYPSVFCIGLKGKTLVVMNGEQSPSLMSSKLTDAFQKLSAELEGSTAEATPPVAQATATATPQPQQEEGVASDVGGAGGTQEEDKEEKLQHYRDKIQQRREEREKQEAEREKQQELQRRTQGKDLAETHRDREKWQQQTWMEERRKEREADKKAREEIRAKLAQDRLERQASDRADSRTEGVNRTGGGRIEGVKRTDSGGTEGVKSLSRSISVCRVQVKLPEGRSEVMEVSPLDTLGDLRCRIAELLTVEGRSISLSSLYPRRQLGAELDASSMTQLDLTPSATILVKLSGKGSGGFLASGSGEGGSSVGGGGVLGAMWSLLVYIYQLIVGFFQFVASAFTGGSSAQERERMPSTHSGTSSSSSSSSGSSAGSGRGGGGGASREGAGLRVRKFRQEDYQDDSDEERRKGTYNGNSTQQQ